MAKADVLSILYSKNKSPLEFAFDSLWLPSLYNYLTVQDIAQLHYIASSARYSSKMELKYKAIDEILRPRGFRKFHCGTNRIVYSYLEDKSFLIKIALDKVGLSDNPAEYKNQFLLKPFVTKVFEVSPCGTVATVERVDPITSRQEFISIAEDIFELLNKCIIGKYVLEDVGTKYFMNWGLRKGFGAVLLDYTYVYELDGNKLYCNKQDPLTGEICNGEIDYDNGFNNLLCSKCGKLYLAKQLQQSVENKLIILKDEGEIEMKIRLVRGQETIARFNTNDESDCILVDKRKTVEKSSISPRIVIGDTDNTVKDNMVKEIQEEIMLKGKVSLSFKVDSPKGYEIDTKTEKVNTPVVNTTTTIKQETIEKKEVVEEKKEEVKYKDKSLEAAEPIDFFESLGLKESDFEEPKEEKKIEVKKNDDILAKYRDEYSDEEENFQRIKKGKKKNILNEY